MKKILLVLALGATMIFSGCAVKSEPTKEQPKSEPAPVVTETTVETTKTYNGETFTFNYPAKYTADAYPEVAINKVFGLWDEEGYKYHKNPLPQCDTCQIPTVEVNLTKITKTLEAFLIEKYGLPGKTLAEAAKQAGIPYSSVKLGDNEFTKIAVADMLTETGYFTKNGDNIVGFVVFDIHEGPDNEELKTIVSSLKFK